MKPNSLIAERAYVTPMTLTPAAGKPCKIERVWVKVEGKLECRFVAVDAK